MKSAGEEVGAGLSGGRNNKDFNTQDLNDLLAGKSSGLVDESLVQSQVPYIKSEVEILAPKNVQRLTGNGSQGLRNTYEEAGNLLQTEKSMSGKLMNKRASDSSDLDDMAGLDDFQKFLRGQIKAFNQGN